MHQSENATGATLKRAIIKAFLARIGFIGIGFCSGNIIAHLAVFVLALTHLKHAGLDPFLDKFAQRLFLTRFFNVESKAMRDKVSEPVGGFAAKAAHIVRSGDCLDDVDCVHRKRRIGVRELEMLHDADVVLNSSDSEGQSNALLEAGALGCPRLARDVAGNRDIITHGQDGWLYGDTRTAARGRRPKGYSLYW